MDSLESVWEFDCPQFVDFAEPHPLDNEPEVYFDNRQSVVPRNAGVPGPEANKTEVEADDKLISNAAPSNIFSSLAEWRKTSASEEQQIDPQSTRSRAPQSQSSIKADAGKQKATRSSTTQAALLVSAAPTRASLKRSHGPGVTQGEEKPAAKSMKRSASSTEVGPPKTLKRNTSSSTFQAPKTLQRSTSTSSAVRPALMLKRSCSSSKLTPTNNLIKRSNSTATLNRHNSVESLNGRASSRSPALSRNSRHSRTHSRSPMTRARISSIERQPIRRRGTSLERPLTGNGRELRPRSLDPRAHTGTQSLDEADCNMAGALPHKMPRPTCTMTNTPTFMRRQKFGTGADAKGKTSEDIELERIETFRKDLESKRKRNETMCKKVLNTMRYMPVHHAKSVTVVQEFEFKTDSRLKNPKGEKQETTAKDFAHMLRSNAAKTQPHKAGLTIVRPFNLTESRKRKSDDDQASGGEFKSIAQQVTAFHRQTPDRFRSRTKEPALAARGRSKSPASLTIPKTPSFETRTRSRAITLPSRQELEEIEIEEIRNNQFKAKPVNQKIFDHSNLGVKKVDSRPVTQTEAFKLSSDHRIMTRSSANNSSEEERHEFHAKPIPARILEGTTGLKPAKHLPVTFPQSPAFVLKHRAALRPTQESEEKEETAPLRRRPVPHTGIPFQPRLNHRRTVVEPFPFEERDKERLAKKEEKIKQVLEEEKKARDFHANPLPDSVVSGEVNLPPKQAKPATVAQAFELSTDTRVKKRQEEFNQKVGKAGVEEEREEQKNLAKFRAQENNVIYQEPFIPKKSIKALTDVNEFELNTERRANHREAFEQSKKHREAQIEAHMREEEIRKEEEDREAVLRLRQEMVHRANPIKFYKHVEVQRCDKPLTLPESPNFATKHRLRSNVRM